MLSGLIGRKCGMTRIFTEDGVSIPVTVIEISPNRITQVKTIATDGYNAVQVTTGEKKLSRINKPEAGHFAKFKVVAGEKLVEFRLDDAASMEQFSAGNEMLLQDHFKEDELVKVVGTSKGKGFAGVVKRWNFSTQRMSHGNSLSHRAPGSIGQCQFPGRVFKGKKMAGHMGSHRTTVQNLVVVKVDEKNNVLLVKGAVPGSVGGFVIVKKLIKEVGAA